jgi:hypothetical protein
LIFPLFFERRRALIGYDKKLTNRSVLTFKKQLNISQSFSQIGLSCSINVAKTPIPV